MTSISSNPIMAAVVNAVAKEIVSSMANFAKMNMTAVGVDQAMMRAMCGTPTMVTCGLPVKPLPVCVMPMPPRGGAGAQGIMEGGCVVPGGTRVPTPEGGWGPIPDRNCWLPPFCTPSVRRHHRHSTLRRLQGRSGPRRTATR